MANEDLASFEFSHLSLLFIVKKESIKFKKKYISKSSLRRQYFRVYHHYCLHLFSTTNKHFFSCSVKELFTV